MTKNTTTNNYRIRADQLQNLEIDRNGRVTPRLHDLDPFQNTLLSVLYPGIKVASVNVPAGPLDDYEEAQVENALARLVWNSVHYKLVGASGSAKKGKFYFVDQEHSRAIAERFQHWPQAAIVYFGILVSPCKVMMEERCARGCGRTGTDPDTNAPDRADLRLVNYSARTVEVEARPETTARKLDPLLRPQGRPGDGAVGQGHRLPRYCLSGFLHAIGGTCCLAKPPPGCGHANDGCRVLRRLSSLSFARSQSDYYGANGEAQRSRCKRRAKRERRCSCERSGVRSLEWATA